MLRNKKTKVFALALTVAMLVLVFVPFCPRNVGVYRGMGSMAGRLTYHFFHAGILHWFVNVWCFLSCVFLMRVAFRHVAAAFAIAATAPALSQLPTVGFSGVCFALLGIVMWQSRQRAFYNATVIASIALCALLVPHNVNNLLHAYCYVGGIAVGFADAAWAKHNKGGGDMTEKDCKKTELAAVAALLATNDVRTKAANAPFNPVTGEGSTGKRVKVHIRDFPTPTMWLPEEMMQAPFLVKLLKAKTVKNFMRLNDIEYNETNFDLVVETFIRVRILYDFPFWAYTFAKIKPKGRGEDIPFRLRPSQRKLVEQGFENLKVLHAPVRLIILKARQWGGSTCTQLFMVWLQVVHTIGLNSLIIAQDLSTATVIQEMFRNAIEQYPARLLHPLGDAYSPKETKWAGVGSVQNIHKVPQRKCKITVGSMERPESCRGGDYGLVHCSEVGVWKKTLGKEPEDVIDAATGGMGLEPMTMVVYESTAKGTGNFFHREWQAAKEGSSQFKGIFIPWYEIPDRYWLDFADAKEKLDFARRLYNNRRSENVMSDREEPGKYLWWLWTKGATLEGIHWYIEERRKYHDHAHMASEYPTDDIEAFTHSGTSVFDPYLVDRFRADCRKPKFIGDIMGKTVRGSGAIEAVRLVDSMDGRLWVWQEPETFPDERVMYRYLVVVDIGGRWRKADYSVIAVFDRYDMMENGLPAVVAQWRGHIDHDLLAWKAAQIAAFYDNALLVIESNTLDKEKETDDGDQSGFILNQIKDVYDNLYARTSHDQQAIFEGRDTMYGFHTNTKTKPEIISNLIEVVRDRLYIERDAQCLDEYQLYELADGKYQATPGPGHHDDILMTRAIGLWVCYREMPRPYFVKLSDMHFTTTVKLP